MPTFIKSTGTNPRNKKGKKRKSGHACGAIRNASKCHGNPSLGCQDMSLFAKMMD